MDRQKELESIDNETMRLCGYMARVRAIPMPERMFKNEKEKDFLLKGRIYVERCAIQIGQLLEFKGFITATADSYLQLLEQPEQAEKIGREGLKGLHVFLKDYTGLLVEEHSWCR